MASPLCILSSVRNFQKSAPLVKVWNSIWFLSTLPCSLFFVNNLSKVFEAMSNILTAPSSPPTAMSWPSRRKRPPWAALLNLVSVLWTSLVKGLKIWTREDPVTATKWGSDRLISIRSGQFLFCVGFLQSRNSVRQACLLSVFKKLKVCLKKTQALF